MPALQAKPFRLVGDSVVQAVQTVLARAMDAWAEDWGMPPPDAGVTVQRAWANAAQKKLAWRERAQAAGRQLWVACGADVSAGLQHALFPCGADATHGVNTGLAQAGAEQAREALLDALIRALLAGQQNTQRDGAGPPADLWECGSGAVLAQFALCGRAWHILLDGVAVQAFQAPAARLPALAPVNVARSVAHVPVSLRLEAGAARVGLGALLALAPGDVIRVDLLADAPLALHTLSGHPVLNAYLGRSGDGLAVELVHRPVPVGEVS